MARHLPKGFSLNEAIKRAFDNAAARRGVSSDVAAAIFDEVLGTAITDHQQQAAREQQDVARITEQNNSIMRDRWGQQYDERKAHFDAAAAEAGYDPAGLWNAYASRPLGANLIDGLTKVGARLVAPAPQPAPQLRSTDGTKSGTPSMPKTAKALDRELKELQQDPTWRKRFFDERHPMHEEAVEDRRQLLERREAARAVERGEVAQVGSTSSAERARAELKRLEKDPKWMAEFRDPRHIRHRDRVAEREQLAAEMAKEVAPQRRPTRTAADIRRSVAELQHDPEFVKTMALGHRHRSTAEDLQYQAANERYQGLGSELAVAERQEGITTTQQQAAGDPQGDAS